MQTPFTSYGLTRDYPGRWTGPLTTTMFFLLAILLGIINIPLTAYELVQEVTYNPNQTSTPLLFSSMLPQIMLPETPIFIPQTVRIGDAIRTDARVFTYTVKSVGRVGGLEAMADGSDEKDITDSNILDSMGRETLFSYFNTKLSDCDVSSITLSISGANTTGRSEVDLIAKAWITCWKPNPYWMDVSFSYASLGRWIYPTPAQDPYRVLDTMRILVGDLVNVLKAHPYSNITDLTFTALPCCNCTGDPLLGAEKHRQGGAWNMPGEQGYRKRWLLTDHPACDNQAPRFRVDGIPYTDPGKTVLKDRTVLPPVEIVPSTENFSGNHSMIFENTLMGIYHAVRTDLGIIRLNNPFFNQTRWDQFIRIPRNIALGGNDADTTNMVWPGSNSTLMAARGKTWSAEAIETRTPSMPYTRSIYKLKSTPSAIISVFVATFSMLSFGFTIAHLILGFFLLRSKAETANRCEGCLHRSGEMPLLAITHHDSDIAKEDAEGHSAELSVGSDLNWRGQQPYVPIGSGGRGQAD